MHATLVFVENSSESGPQNIHNINEPHLWNTMPRSYQFIFFYLNKMVEKSRTSQQTFWVSKQPFWVNRLFWS